MATLEEFKLRVASIGIKYTCLQAPEALQSDCNACMIHTSKSEEQKIACVAEIVFNFRQNKSK